MDDPRTQFLNRVAAAIRLPGNGESVSGGIYLGASEVSLGRSSLAFEIGQLEPVKIGGVEVADA